MRTAPLVLFALALAACGRDEGGEPVGAPPDANRIVELSTPPTEETHEALVRLQPIAPEELDVEELGGTACTFVRGGQILLAASGSDALVKVNGELRHLVQSASVGPTGGFFEDRQLSVSVGRTDEAGIDETAGRWPARITLTHRRARARQEIEGDWSCGA